MRQDSLPRMVTSRNSPLIYLKRKVAITGSAIVYQGTTAGGKHVVLKQMRFKPGSSSFWGKFRKTKEDAPIRSKTRIEHEIDLLKQCKHPFVLRCMDTIWDSSSCWMVTELCCADAESIGERPSDEEGNYEPRMAFKLMYHLMIPIMKALKHVHSLGIIHGDVKPENILITPRGVPKLSDFGISGRKESKMICQSAFGTEDFIAPELFRHSEYDERVDVWSWSISCLFLLRGYKFRFVTKPKLFIHHYRTADLRNEKALQWIQTRLHLRSEPKTVPEDAEFREWMRGICIPFWRDRPTSTEVCGTKLGKNYLKAWKHKNELFKSGHRLLYEEIRIRLNVGMVADPTLPRDKKPRIARTKKDKLVDFLNFIVI